MTCCSARSRAAPDQIALVHDTRRLSYAQLGHAIDRLAHRLLDLGFRPLDRVVFQFPNSIEFVIAFFALLRIGVIPVLALPAHRRDEIAHIFAHTKATGLLRGRPLAWLRLSIAGRRNVRHGAVAAPACSCSASPVPIRFRLSDLLADDAGRNANAAALAAVAPSPDEIALMLLSGGTTGMPKVIPRTHNDYVYNCRQSGDDRRLQHRNRVPGLAADGAQLHARLSRRARRAGPRRHGRDRAGYNNRNRRALDRNRARIGHLRRRSADRQLAERQSPAASRFLHPCAS